MASSTAVARFCLPVSGGGAPAIHSGEKVDTSSSFFRRQGGGGGGGGFPPELATLHVEHVEERENNGKIFMEKS